MSAAAFDGKFGMHTLAREIFRVSTDAGCNRTKHLCLIVACKYSNVPLSEIGCRPSRLLSVDAVRQGGGHVSSVFSPHFSWVSSSSSEGPVPEEPSEEPNLHFLEFRQHHPAAPCCTANSQHAALQARRSWKPLGPRAREKTTEYLSTPEDRGAGKHRWPQSVPCIIGIATCRAPLYHTDCSGEPAVSLSLLQVGLRQQQ